METFCSSMKDAETTAVAMSARAVCTMRLFSPLGTYWPSTLPVAMGTSAPRTTAARPPRTRLRSSRAVPRTLKRSSAGRPTRPSGSGR